MDLPTVEDRKRQALFVLGQNSFEDAINAIDHIIDNELELYCPIYYPLIVSFCVLYGRPFTKNYGIGNLRDLFRIPKNLSETHDEILNFRNQYYAHRQAHPSCREDDAKSYPIFKRISISQLKWELIDPVRSIVGLSAYRKVAKFMEKKCLYQTNKFNIKYDRYLSSTKIGREYSLNCQDPDIFFD